MWFETLTGFAEESPDQVRENLAVAGDVITSHVNGKQYTYGDLETPTLAELRSCLQLVTAQRSPTTIREVVADVQQLHTDEQNAGALFQVASQFNLLEMLSPSVTPECGVGIYANDRTQGPACAIAGGAGTIYRNYFIPVNGQIGQSEHHQIDCLKDLGEALGNSDGRLWKMVNGYALATEEGLAEITDKLRHADEQQRDALRDLILVGVQSNTQVTLSDCRHCVTQVYCSALPVAYSRVPSAQWAEFAKLVLEAAYEATICAAILNTDRPGNNTVFLTLLGGGAFGNEPEWILSAIKRCLHQYEERGLDIAVVSYRSPQPYLRELIG